MTSSVDVPFIYVSIVMVVTVCLGSFLPDLILDDLVYTNQIGHEHRQQLRDVLMKHHHHQCDKQKRKSKTSIGSRKASVPFDLGKKFEGLTGSKTVPANLPNMKDKDQPIVGVAKRNEDFPHLPSAVDLVKEDGECDQTGSADACVEKVAVLGFETDLIIFSQKLLSPQEYAWKVAFQTQTKCM